MMRSVIDRIIHSIVRVHRPVLTFALAAALISVGLLIRPGLRQDYSIDSLVAGNNEGYRRFVEFGRQFVSGEMALILVDAGDPLERDNLELQHWICQECSKIEGVESLLSLSELPELGLWAMFSGKGRLQTIYERLRDSSVDRARIAADLRNNPLVIGSLVGQDPKTGELTSTTGIVVQVSGDAKNPLRRQVVQRLRRVVAEARLRRSDATILLGGPLIGLTEISEAIRHDMAIFSGVVAILTCVAIGLILRRWLWILVTFVTGAVAVLIVLGLSIVVGMPMSLVSQTVVVLVAVMAVSMCIHLLVGHEETRLHLGDVAHGPLFDSRRTLGSLLVPCFVSALGAVLGFGTLGVSQIRPIRDVAILGTVGASLALILGAMVLPAVSRLAARRPPVRNDRGKLSEGVAWLGQCAGVSGTWRVGVLAICAGLVGLCAIKVPAAFHNYEGDFVRSFRENSDLVKVSEYIEHHLTPVGNIEVVVRRKDGGPVIGESAMGAIEAARRERRSIDRLLSSKQQEVPELQAMIARQLRIPVDQALAGVGLIQSITDIQESVLRDLNPPVRKVISLADVIEMASIGRMLGLPGLRGPLFESQFALTMVLIDQRLSEELIRHFMTRDGKFLRINLRAMESDDVRRKVDVAERVRKTAARILGPDYAVEVTGLYPLHAQITLGLPGVQAKSFVLAWVGITVLICVVTRSVGLGLVGMLLNLIPMILCLGIMGWAGIPISMATAMMLSIALGIAAGNTTHYLWRFRRELAVDQDYASAIVRSHRTVGTACVFSGLVALGGFWVLCLSEIVSTSRFGLLGGLFVLGGLLSVIVLLPVLLILLRPVSAGRFEV